MWRGEVPPQRNPMQLVEIKGATKRLRNRAVSPRKSSTSSFRNLKNPFVQWHWFASVSGSESASVLRSNGQMWIGSTASSESSGASFDRMLMKAIYSQRPMAIDNEMLGTLKTWKQTTEFAKDDDWIFAAHRSWVDSLFPTHGYGEYFKKLLLQLVSESLARTHSVTATVHGLTRSELPLLFSKS